MSSNSKLNIKSLIFDMDGTLIDTLHDISYAVNIILKKYKFPLHSYDDYKKFIGKGIKNLINMALPYDFKGNYENIYLEIQNTYEANMHSKTIVYEGIYDILDFLTNRNIKLGICTNKPHSSALKCVKKYFINYSLKTVGAGYVSSLKPNPSGLINILNYFDVKSSNCLFIGDSDIDIFTAKNAKTFSVGALWGFRSKEELERAGADFLFEQPEDCLTFLKNVI